MRRWKRRQCNKGSVHSTKQKTKQTLVRQDKEDNTSEDDDQEESEDEVVDEYEEDEDDNGGDDEDDDNDDNNEEEDGDDDEENEDEDEDEDDEDEKGNKKRNRGNNEVENLQDKWKNAKKTSQNVKLAKDYVLQNKGRKFGLVRRKDKTLQEMEDEHELMFNKQKQKLLSHKRRLENEIGSVNAKKSKRSQVDVVQSEKETKLAMVFDEIVKIHKLLLEERKVETHVRKMELKMQSECMLLFMNWMQAMLEK